MRNSHTHCLGPLLIGMRLLVRSTHGRSGPSCRKLGEVLPGLLTDYRPDLVLYDAGIDPHKGDALGRLALTDEGLHRQELMVNDARQCNRMSCVVR